MVAGHVIECGAQATGGNYSFFTEIPMGHLGFPIAELHPDAPRYKGGVTRSATEWNTLCRGNLDRMVTDTKQLLIQGMQLAGKTFAAARQAMGWVKTLSSVIEPSSTAPT